MIIFLFSFIYVYNEKLLKDNVTYSQKIVKNTVTYLDNYIDELDSIAISANYNYYLQNYLIEEIENETGYGDFSNKKSVHDYEINSKLFGYEINNRIDVSSIMIFGRKRLLLYKTMYSYQYVVDNFRKYPWYSDAINDPNKVKVTGPQQHSFLLGNTDDTVSISRMIRNYKDGSFLGVILIDVNLNRIREICDGIFHESEGKICVINEEGHPIYEQDSGARNEKALSLELSDKLLGTINSGARESLIYTVAGKEYQIVYNQMGKTGWIVMMLTPVDTLQGSLVNTVKLIIGVFIIILSITLILLEVMMTNIVNPISRLQKQVDTIDKGNLELIELTPRKDEIGDLTTSFNHMIERVQNLEEKIINDQEEKRKLELQALQGQINPHFLYNTLDSIIWMAEIKDDHVVPMTEALAKLFRLSLNQGKEMFTIEEELEHVKNYLIIQSMRYVNKFDYSIEVQDSIRKYRIIKLILQPIVENSIYHGIKEKKGKGRISIRAYQEEDMVRLKVEDDGIGMSEDQCSALLSGKIEPSGKKGSGIGFKNVNERIKMYFGNPYGVSISSEINKGTTVVISIPAPKE